MARAIALAAMLAVVGLPARASEPLRVVAAGALKPGLQRVVALWRSADRNPVEISYDSSGAVVDSLRGENRVDVIIVGHQNFMDLAERDGLVDSTSRRDLAFLIPVLVVPKGNPKGVHQISDLMKPGMRLALADPGSTCLGTTTMEILDRVPQSQELLSHVVVQSHSCEATFREVVDGHVDAVVGWHVLPDWAAGKVALIRLPEPEVPEARVVAATSRQASNAEGAKAFLEFLASPMARGVFRERGYPTSVEERAKMLQSADFARSW